MTKFVGKTDLDLMNFTSQIWTIKIYIFCLEGTFKKVEQIELFYVENNNNKTQCTQYSAVDLSKFLPGFGR